LIDYFGKIFVFVYFTKFLRLKNQTKLVIIDLATLQLSSKLLLLRIPCRSTKYCQRYKILFAVKNTTFVKKNI